MADLLANLVLLWVNFGTLVFFVVVIVLGLVLPAKFHGGRGLAVSLRRILGTLGGMAIVLSVMMIVSQWVISQYFVQALTVSEMMRDVYVQGLLIYLFLGLPFVLIRTFLLHIKASKQRSL